jgi:group I intron endonuclease
MELTTILSLAKDADPKSSGIYMIYCKEDNKAYIGQSKNIYRRFLNHKNHLISGKHDNSYLYRAYVKYGISSFRFCVLELCDFSELNNKEEYYISLIGKEHLFNIGKIGDVLPVSEETKKKLSEKRKNRIFTMETREKIGKAHKGKKLSEETKQKLKEANLGKKHSKETLEKMSKTRLGKKRKPHSKETKKKLSEKNKGYKHTEETKKKMSNSHKGKPAWNKGLKFKKIELI